jgi:hypothetical protein
LVEAALSKALLGKRQWQQQILRPQLGQRCTDPGCFQQQLGQQRAQAGALPELVVAQ